MTNVISPAPPKALAPITTAYDDVRVLGGEASGLSFVLPALLHGQDAQHDGLGAADTGGSYGARVVTLVGGRVEQTTNHGNTTVLNVG